MCVCVMGRGWVMPMMNRGQLHVHVPTNSYLTVIGVDEMHVCVHVHACIYSDV